MKFLSRRASAVAVVALATAVALPGCGSSDTKSTSGSSGGGGKATTITFLPKNLGNPNINNSDADGKKAVAEFGGKFSEVGPQEAAADAQVQYINTAAQQGVNGLVISADDPKAICDAIKEARDAGTKVVAFDCDSS